MVRFVKYSYDSIYHIEPHETYGMGRESLNCRGCTEINQLESILEMITQNGLLDKHTVMNPKFEFVEYTEEELKNMDAHYVCNKGSPCGLYGCTKPGEHEMHWVVSHAG